RGLRARALGLPGGVHRGWPPVLAGAEPEFRADRILPVGGGERGHVPRCLAVPEPGRDVGDGARRQMGILGTAGEPELHAGGIAADARRRGGTTPPRTPRLSPRGRVVARWPVPVGRNTSPT